MPCDPTRTDASVVDPAPRRPAVEPLRSPVRRWWMALLAAALTMGVQWTLQPSADAPIGWILPYPAVVLTALRQGFGPGLLTAVLGGLGATFVGSPADTAPSALPAQWGLYGSTAIVIALACAQSPKYRHRSACPSVASAALRVDTPLTRWLEAVIWGAGLVPLTLFGSAAWWGYTESIATGEERVARANKVTLQHAERSFGTAIDVTRMARDLAAQSDTRLRANQAEVRQRLQDMMLGMTAVQAITIWDADGRIVVGSVLKPAIAKTSIADRPYFERARRGGDEIFITDPLKSRISGATVINAVARRRAADGSFAGVVAVALSPNHFQDFYQSLASEQSGLGSFAVFTAEGAVLSRWPPAPDGLRLPDESKLAQAVRVGQTAGVLRVRSAADGRRRMISFTRLSRLPIYASTALDEAVMFEPWHRFVALLAAVMGPLAAGLVYVSWLALKKTRREQIVLLELQAEMRRRGQTEKALAQAQRLEALSVLTGGVAHDFNNLLAIVNGNLHMIRRHHPDVGGGRHLTAISRAVASGVRLTRQLLSFARRQALTPEQIVLQIWLPGMSDLLQSTVGRSVAVQITVAPDVPPIRVDAGELELALINLATNARDAMDGQGTLDLAVARSAAPDAGGSAVVIRVSDTGGGIAPDLLAKVFEPFFTTKPPSKGTGLGLSQVHGFCLQAGGHAAMESEAGRGTTVVLSFPADVPPAAPADERGSAGDPHRIRGRVLIVEDNPDVAATHCELLESTGATVEVVATGEAAQRLLERRDGAPHGLVVSDIAMPGAVDGIQLAVWLQRARPEIPVLLLTGHAARLEDAQRLGCRVLGKPVDPERLIAEVAEVMRPESVDC